MTGRHVSLQVGKLGEMNVVRVFEEVCAERDPSSTGPPSFMRGELSSCSICHDIGDTSVSSPEIRAIALPSLGCRCPPLGVCLRHQRALNTRVLLLSTSF